MKVSNVPPPRPPQVLVVCFTVFGGLMAFNYNRALQVWAIPLLLAAFFAYLVAHSFLSVFETVLNTLFLCLAVDLETNDGSPEKPYFMYPEFLVSKHFISLSYPSSRPPPPKVWKTDGGGEEQHIQSQL